MQDYELDAWLGDTEVTDQQRVSLLIADQMIGDRYQGDDLEDARETAFTGAAQVILGDNTLQGVADQWQRARIAEREAMATLTGAIIASAGTPETEIARVANVDRMTVRKALGK